MLRDEKKNILRDEEEKNILRDEEKIRYFCSGIDDTRNSPLF